jgi:uncharacterized protein
MMPCPKRHNRVVKICIVSDSHDRADPLARAVMAAREAGAQAVLHCGDLIGAQTIKPALAAGLPVHAIHGNNLGDPRAMEFQSRKSGGQLQYHGPDAVLELGGRSIFMVHYDNYGFAFACTGAYDLVCCGHSHNAEARQVPNVKGGRSWLVNPGTVAGLSAPATWVLGDLATMRFEIFSMPA